jgi:hypothetical protein
MALIDSSYFDGELTIPNSMAPDVSSLITALINQYEKEYLKKALGYELSKLFAAGLLAGVIDQRYLDILLGAEFRDSMGNLSKWPGLISVVNPETTISVSLTNSLDQYFTVGVDKGPNAGASVWVNNDLAGINYKVAQRVQGPLEPLKSDNSNIATADISINVAGGFTLLNGIQFAAGDKYIITPLSSPIDVSNVELAELPQSPIADYVYVKWAEGKSLLSAGIGTVKPAAQNATLISDMENICRAWNNMVEKTKLLAAFLESGGSVYPEFQAHAYSQDFILLTTRLNPYFN